MKRRTPEIGSIPIVPTARPNPTIKSDIRTEPPDSRERIASPATASAKYSGGPNFSARSASHEAKSTMPTTPTEPATNEPTAETASAAPARPVRAIW